MTLTTTHNVTQGRLYAGPVPEGAEILGTVTRDGTDTGALVRLANGRRVQINAGAVRALPPEAQEAAMPTHIPEEV